MTLVRHQLGPDQMRQRRIALRIEHTGEVPSGPDRCSWPNDDVAGDLFADYHTILAAHRHPAAENLHESRPETHQSQLPIRINGIEASDIRQPPVFQQHFQPLPVSRGHIRHFPSPHEVAAAPSWRCCDGNTSESSNKFDSLWGISVARPVGCTSFYTGNCIAAFETFASETHGHSSVLNVNGLTRGVQGTDGSSKINAIIAISAVTISARANIGFFTVRP